MSYSAEYFARYNLGNDVPFVNYTNGIVSYSEISNASRGSYRPTWELLYAHYGQIKGLDVPWTEQYMNYTNTGMGGFEGGAGSWGEGSGHYDGLGWGSLLYHLDPSDVVVLSNSEANLTIVTNTATTSLNTTSPVIGSTTIATDSKVDPTSASSAAIEINTPQDADDECEA